MRPIKFRGKQKDTGEWEYGNHYGTGKESLELFWMNVADGIIDIETVGQSTGLKDKNGKENYHKDILDWDGNRFIVEWDDDNGMWYGQQVAGNKERGALVGLAFGNTINVGNVHDNPELLKEKE